MNTEGYKQTQKQSIILGIFFLLLVTTYSSFSHIATYITEHDPDRYHFEGEVSLIVNYVVYLVGLTRAASISNFKRQFLIAAICYSSNYALYLLGFTKLFGLLTAAVGAAIGGFGASVLWVSQGGYMMRLFNRNKIEKDHQGYYMGIQNGLVYTSNFIGAAITAFGLGLFGNEIYFLILTGVGITGFALCKAFLDPLQESVNLRGGEQSEQNVGCTTIFLQNLKSYINFYPKMKYLIAALFLDGLMLGFITSFFSHMIPLQIRSSENIGFVLMVNGLGSIIGGYLSGYLSDKVRPSKLGVAGFMFIIMTLLIALLSQYVKIQTLAFPYVVSFLWGVSLFFLQGWLFVCCAKVYNGKMESFSIVKQIHTIAYIIFLIYMIISDNQINAVAYLILLIIISIIALISSRLMQAIEEKSQGHNEMVEEAVNEASPPG